VQLGYRNAVYHWPAFARDTFTRSFVLKERRLTGEGSVGATGLVEDAVGVLGEEGGAATGGGAEEGISQPWIYTFDCQLRNQRGKLVFSAEKLMMFNIPCAGAGDGHGGDDDGESATDDGSAGAGAGAGAGAAESAGSSFAAAADRSSELERHLISTSVQRLSTYQSDGGGDRDGDMRRSGVGDGGSDGGSGVGNSSSQSLTPLRPGKLLLHVRRVGYCFQTYFRLSFHPSFTFSRLAT
jgi:hypothetical protein